MRPAPGCRVTAAAPPAVLVFAREPVAGAVKTRLTPGLSAAQAATLYARMLEGALRAARGSGLGPVVLCHAPAPALPRLQALSRAYAAPLRPQVGDDLGARMHEALQAAVLEHGAALLIGSDCPALDAARLRAAARVLADGAPAVFVPAVDGGYVLVGCGRPPPPSLFAGLPWGTPGVMAGTRERLRSIGWCWRELAPLRDVDTVQDLDLVPRSLRAP